MKERKRQVSERREKTFQESKEGEGTPSPYLNIFIEVRMREYECLESMKGVGILKNLKSHMQLLCKSHE